MNGGVHARWADTLPCMTPPSDRPTDPDLLKPTEPPPSLPEGSRPEADVIDLGPRLAYPPPMKASMDDLTPVPAAPSMRDLFVELRETRQEFRTEMLKLQQEMRDSGAAIGDSYGERLKTLEDDMKRMRRHQANGVTPPDR